MSADERAPRFDGLAPSSVRASRTAAAIKRKDTRAEVALRRALWASGVRYRKHARALPGNPDLVLGKARVVIFIDGDFWHGRDWESRRAKLAEGSNAPYWIAKIDANRQRDARKTCALEALGWRVVRVWETDVLRDPEGEAKRIIALLHDRATEGLPDAPRT